MLKIPKIVQVGRDTRLDNSCSGEGCFGPSSSVPLQPYSIERAYETHIFIKTGMQGIRHIGKFGSEFVYVAGLFFLFM
jgi:hypothetical protein